MKLRPDQQRVASLLKETITLMCRNGLIFDSQFCIEATIGVTLDDKDVFVVSLNEVIGKDERSDVESNGGDPLPGSPEKKPLAIKRGRPRKKTPKVTPKKAARRNKAEDSWGESADDFDDYASSDDASPPAKKSKDLLQEELNMTCDAGENVAVKQELQYDSSNVSRVPEEGEELLFSLEGQQSSELQLQQASNSMSESTSQVPSTSQQLLADDVSWVKLYGASKRGRLMLTNSLGYTYVVSKTSQSTVSYVCTVRSRKQCCKARVLEKDGRFQQNLYGHCHPPNMPTQEALRRYMSRSKVTKVEFQSPPQKMALERKVLERKMLEGTVQEGMVPEGTAPEGTVMEGTVMEGKVPEGTVLDGMALEGTAPEGTVLDGMALEGTAPEGTVLEGMALEGTTLEGTCEIEFTMTEDVDGKFRIDSS